MRREASINALPPSAGRQEHREALQRSPERSGLVVTLGIYSIIWYYRINPQMKHEGVNVNPSTAVLSMLLGWMLILPTAQPSGVRRRGR